MRPATIHIMTIIQSSVSVIWPIFNHHGFFCPLYDNSQTFFRTRRQLWHATLFVFRISITRSALGALLLIIRTPLAPERRKI